MQHASQTQRITRRQLDALSEVLLEVLSFQYPADQVVSRYFRAHKELGAGDRRMVAESVYAGLRHYYRVKAMLAGETGPRWFAVATLLGPRGFSVASLEPVLSAKEREWAKAAKSRPTMQELWAQAELPHWVVTRLQTAYRDEEILQLGRALQNPAPLDLRVNTMISDRNSVLQSFQSDQLEASPCPWSNTGVRMEEKPALQRHALFQNGAVEVQDEGSQLIGLLVDPQPGERVVDFCAGAGGKTLQLGALMNNRGRIDAYDISARRLQRLRPRLARSGLSNVRAQVIEHERDAKLKNRFGKADRVLVDAPCTGLGTLRRNPDLKFRQSESALEELCQRQAAILTAAARLVKPGGRLVYATCSLMQEENQHIVNDFLSTHPEFQRVAVNQLLSQVGIGLDTGEDLVLLPHLHHTDGFYAAVMRRVSE